MNNVFIIKNDLHGEDPSFPSSDVKFNKNDRLDSSHIKSLIENLIDLKKYWIDNQDYIDGSIIQINYYNLVPKTKRVTVFLSNTNYENNVVGAKYNYYEGNIGLSIIYKSKDINDFDLLIQLLGSVHEYVITNFNGVIDHDSLDEAYSFIKTINNLSKNNFVTLLLEISRIRSIGYPKEEFETKEEQIVKFYVDPFSLKKKLDIHVLKSTIYDKVAVLTKNDIEFIKNNAPYLVSQSFERLFENPSDDEQDFVDIDVEPLETPGNEKIIGQIDGAMVKNTELDSWVESEDLRDNKDYSIIDKLTHATKVCSILVHGGDINKTIGLDDRCGHFKVKHFAVLDDYTDVFDIAERIEKIVRNNYKHIKVWNLSLGTNSEIPSNFISPLAALLDNLQAELDIIFVISATNKPKDYWVGDNYKIGSPADSVNSLVVGSVKMIDKKRASYSRLGGALNFFIKPDISYYGGDDDQMLYAYNGFRYVKCKGTSFAAPFIARKLAFLIYNVGLSREEAKALIIHSSSDWVDKPEDIEHIGRGIVFSDITDILSTSDDEIRFIFSNNTKAFYSDNYSLPIPLNSNGKSPFAVKATMCYFTSCSANYGVDYTNIEVDFKFGPATESGLSSVKDNGQYELGRFVNEETAREEFCKWDNVKHIFFSGPKTQKGIKSAPKWGFKLTTSYRNGLDNLSKTQKYNFPVGIVVTLKSNDGVNRIGQFRRDIERTSWEITPIDVNNIIETKIRLKEKIIFKN